jgi:hypothetical protein
MGEDRRMGSSRMFAMVVLGALVGGCGTNSGNPTNDGASQTASHVEQQIRSREEAALPHDPSFPGEPSISVKCSGSSCKATLAADIAKGFPIAEDYWTISGGSPKLQGGSNIVGFMAADARFACLDRSATAASLQPLRRCSRVVAHKLLP